MAFSTATTMTSVPEKASLPYSSSQETIVEPPPCFIQWSFDEKKPVAVSEYSLEKGILAEEDENPETLAELYFKFGFILPFFWIAGAYIIYPPLTVDYTLKGTRFKWFHWSQADAVLDTHRRVELKWAWRCFWALLALMATIVLTAIVVTAVLSVKAKQQG